MNSNFSLVIPSFPVPCQRLHGAGARADCLSVLELEMKDALDRMF